ncbi:hypothetical protein MNBD_GAMMA08-3054 [hydrothermal vent metagenome]|uniref:Lipoprotein n=1 Tax=hydrothermal vent metagenome TaxID=652676 RepID=A0A3B0WXJ7_9ZZZZ
MFRYHRLSWALIVFMLLSIASCFSGNKDGTINLLSIAVKNSELINHDKLNKELLNITRKLQDTENLPLIFSMLWRTQNAQHSVLSISKTNSEPQGVINVTLILDNIPDDDSVSGYRYDIKIKEVSDLVIEIIQAKKSWRCWEDRGHRNFGVSPCT